MSSSTHPDDDDSQDILPLPHDDDDDDDSVFRMEPLLMPRFQRDVNDDDNESNPPVVVRMVNNYNYNPNNNNNMMMMEFHEPRILQEPSIHVRAAWRDFLESTNHHHSAELRLESLRLTTACVLFLMDRLEWIDGPARPQQLTLCHVNFAADDDDHASAEQQNPLFLPDLLDTVPRSVILFCELILSNKEHWKCVEFEDTIHHPRWRPVVRQALLATLPHLSSKLIQLRLRGLDLRLPEHYRGIDLRTNQATTCNMDNDSPSVTLYETLLAHRDNLLEVDMEACRFDMDTLAKGLVGLVKLQSFSIYECDMDDGGMQQVVNCLEQCVPHLTKVLLYENNITSRSFGTFAHLLRRHKHLQFVKLAFWGQDGGGGADSTLLPSARNSNNNTLYQWMDGGHDMECFNQALQQHESLQCLDIFCKNTSAQQVVAWMHAFEQSRSLQTFRFGVFCLQRHAAPAAASGAEITTTVKQISLDMKYGILAGNNAQELSTLFQGIAQLKTIHQLVLNQTHFYAPHVGLELQHMLKTSSNVNGRSKQHYVAATPSPPPLTDLRLHSCRFYEEAFQALVRGLAAAVSQHQHQHQRGLQTLHLTSCRINDEQMALLGPCLSCLPHFDNDSISASSSSSLRRLDLSWNNLTTSSLPVLNALIKRSLQIQYLNLSHNECLFQVDDNNHDDLVAASVFVDTLIRHPGIATLDLSACGLPMSMATKLLQEWDAKATDTNISSSSVMEVDDTYCPPGLHLGFASVEGGRPSISGDGLQIFCGVRASQSQILLPLLEAVQSMLHVSKLEFCGTDLRGAMPGQRLCRVLGQSSNLMELNIYGVENPPIDHEMMGQLATGLKTQTSLQAIRLGGCSMRDDMLTVLSAGLLRSQNTGLKALYLRYNLLTAESLVTVGALLQHCKCLEDVDLANNEMLFLCNRDELTPFCQALGSHKSLRRLCLSHTGIQGNFVLNEIFRALVRCCHPAPLQELDIGGNTILVCRDSPGSWLDLLAQCHRLQRLKIPRSMRSDPNWDHFLQKLTSNTSILDLRRDQGQLPLVHTKTMHEYDGCPLTERRIVGILRRNLFLYMGLHLVTQPNVPTTTLPWAYLLRQLGSNAQDPTPIFAVLRLKAVELASYRD